MAPALFPERGLQAGGMFGPRSAVKKRRPGRESRMLNKGRLEAKGFPIQKDMPLALGVLTMAHMLMRLKQLCLVSV